MNRIDALADSSVPEKISDSDYQQVKALLGRSPRGLRSIAAVDCDGGAVVIQVASLVNKKPFPTLFWLVDKRLNYAIDQIEARGQIAVFQEAVNSSPSLQQSLADDHRAHIALRESLMTADERRQVEALGFQAVLSKRGIGGIENFTRIRCLHTYYAAHLMVPNTVGRLLDDYWRESGQTFEHLIV